MKIITSPKFFKSKNSLPRGIKKIDVLGSSLEELFFIRNPKLKKGTASEELDDFISSEAKNGVWIYFPWLRTAIQTVNEDLYFELRTARNRNIITSKEQDKYRNFKAGIAGLSVGSGILSALAQSGGPKTIKIADFDTIEISNLNRIRARLVDVGLSKVESAARQVWELDPFADLHVWNNGVTKDNLEEFIAEGPLDVFIDEMDNINLKLFSRVICKKYGIPVIMATDNGDTVILDVERYDLEPNRLPFHGLAGDLNLTDLENIDRTGWLRLATKIIGAEYMTPELQRSILQVGKSLSGVPQLGTTALMAGGAVSLAIRRIASGYKMPSGRYVISLEDVIIPGYSHKRSKKIRQKDTQKFKNILFGKK